jgi:hypothetical protein
MLCTVEDFIREREVYICVDFDGTMVNHVYPLEGEEVPGAVEWCKKFIENGAYIILWTMRDGGALERARIWMESRGIELYGVNTNPSQRVWTTSPKAYGHMYIDDAAIGCPLCRIEGWERPCVDWDEVGPMVLERLK